MARVIGTVGSYSKKLILKRKIFKYIFIFFLLFFLISIILLISQLVQFKELYLYFFRLNFFTKLILIAISLVIIVLLIYISNYMIDAYKALRYINKKLLWVNKGLEAEKKAEKILNQLDDNYIVIHDLVFKTDKNKNANIDHIVIYEPKNLLFLIETKSVSNPSDKQIRFWYKIIFYYMKKLEELLKNKNLLNGKDYKIIPILLLINSSIYNPSSKIVISNAEKILEDIKKYSKLYPSYRNKEIDWFSLFIKIKNI